jgi:hypothetical protein
METDRQDGVKDRILYAQLKDGINNLHKMKITA